MTDRRQACHGCEETDSDRSSAANPTGVSCQRQRSRAALKPRQPPEASTRWLRGGQASFQLQLEALQLLAGGADLSPDKPSDLAPLVDGAARGMALRALGGRDAHLPALLLLDDDAAPTAAPGHQGLGDTRGVGGKPYQALNPKGYSQAVSHACIIHVCHTGYETATTLWYSPTAPDKLSAALITKAQP